MVPAKDKTSEYVTEAFVEHGIGRDDADCGVRAASQGEQMTELGGHSLRAVEPDQGALVNDHLQQPGHADGPVRLAVEEQVPLLAGVAAGEEVRRDLPEVSFGLHQLRDQQVAVDLGEGGLGLGRQHVPAGRAQPGGVRGEPRRRGCSRRAMSIAVPAAFASPAPYSRRIRATSSGPAAANPVSTRISQSVWQPSRAAAWS